MNLPTKKLITQQETLLTSLLSRQTDLKEVLQDMGSKFKSLVPMNLFDEAWTTKLSIDSLKVLDQVEKDKFRSNLTNLKDLNVIKKQSKKYIEELQKISSEIDILRLDLVANKIKLALKPSRKKKI